MQDAFSRNIQYLRVSLTDKCNLRCTYCMPKDGVKFLPHSEILSLEEIERAIAIMASLGVKKVRLTGGEPFVRKGILSLISAIKSTDGIEEICITTNGLFPTYTDISFSDLKKAGVSHLNISLDTLDKSKFQAITGKDGLDTVLSSIYNALSEGFRVKLNCVAAKEINFTELALLASLAKDNPLDVRFIEVMPLGCGVSYTPITQDEILAELRKSFGDCTPCFTNDRIAGPASYVTFKDFTGRVGFISPLSHVFCSSCNRLRLTVDGRMKPCLFYEDYLDLKELLRSGKSDQDIAESIKGAVLSKKKTHRFAGSQTENQIAGSDENSNMEQKKMNQIGG